MRSVSDAVIGAIPAPLIYRLQDHRVIANTIRSMVNLVVPKNLVNVTVARCPMRGARLSLYLRREKAFWLGTYEPDVQRILCERLHPGQIAWDVGAFVGYHTLLMCRLCGPSNVVAIEPDSENALRLWKNLRQNGFHDARVVGAALGAHVGRGLLRRNALDRRQNVVEEIGAGETGEQGGIEVAVKTLDSMLQTYGPPTLIKADVEGAEDLMLQGSVRLIDEVRPFWILEIHGLPGQNAIRMLEKSGYQVRYLRNGERSSADYPVGSQHILAVP